MPIVEMSSLNGVPRGLFMLSLLALLPWDAMAGCDTNPLDRLLLPGKTVGPALGGSGATSLENALREAGVEVGDGVFVTDAKGCRIKADIKEMSVMELALTDGRQTWRLRKGEILQIEKQDSLWNGVGWGLSVSAAVLGRSDLSSEYLSATVGSIAIVVGVGIVIGAVVDANVHRTVYEARPTVWAVKPVVGADRIGAHVAVRW